MDRCAEYMQKKHFLWIIGGFSLIVIVLLLMIRDSNDIFKVEKSLAPVEVPPHMTTLEYETNREDAEKIRDFVVDRMYTEILLDPHAHDGSAEKIALSTLRREALEKLQNALLNEDIDDLLFILPSESIQEAINVELDLNVRIGVFNDILKTLNRQGTFTEITYQFFEDKGKNETNSVVIQLHYEGSPVVEIPIELEQVGKDQHHLYFKFLTPLSEIQQAVLEQTE